MQARYDLAVEAIKTFHTGVSEDFLLKQEQFKDVRDRLLKSASDFYGKLGALLGKESDLASRRALWQANYEVAELTGKVGKPEDALAAHRQVLAAREALAAETRADPEIKADVGRSLTAVAGLLETTGRTEEAEATYRKAETLLVELAPTIAEAAAARAVLANCRSHLGWLLHDHGPQRRSPVGPTAWRVRTRRRWPPPPGRRPSPGGTWRPRSTGSPFCWRATGKPSEAEAEYRKALAIRQKLADDNPAVTEFRSSLAASHNNLGMRAVGSGKPSEAEAEYRTALAIQQKLADDNPAVTDFRSDLAMQPQQPRRPAVGYGQVIGSGGRVPQGAGDPSRSWPTTTPPSPNSAALWHTLSATSARYCSIRASHRKRRPSTARRWRSRKSWPTTTPPSPNFRGIWRPACSTSVGSSRRPEKRTRRSATTRGKRRSGRSSPRPARQPPATGMPWRTARPTRRTCSVGRGGLTRRSPHASAPWRCVSLWSRRIPRSRRYRAGLGETYLRLGQVRCDMKNLAGAAAAWKRACAHYDGSKSLDGRADVLPGLLPRRPGGTRGPTGLGGVRRGGGGPGREGDGRVAPGGHDGLPQPRRLPDRIGPRPAPQPARLPAPDDGPGVPD